MFEITARAAAGRLGRFKTNHGDVTTPTLMPVINPNIDLVPAREMRDRFGCEMVITNSYVIHKYDDLREKALSDGVHSVIDWDGPVMTDSGTFQMYVYGDVEVGPEEIVQFQRDMGVDVATCLDLFVTPDMTREQAEHAVATTLERTKEATAHKGDSLLNATVQGGLFMDLRQACAAAYRDLDVDYHTIGGVVPVMERQMYPELVDIILHSQQHLRKDRPVHLFGAGHPLVFPLATALGCDLFDSSSYAKYAKDGRIMHEGGTLHVEDLAEWPFASADLERWTPQELHKALKSKGSMRDKGPRWEAQRAIALHNLDVCFADMRRIRQAIRDGVLWELVEQRATCHPLLAAATRKLGTPEMQAWLEAREPTSGGKALRYTGHLTHGRPMFHRIRRRMTERLSLLGEPVESMAETHWAKEGQEKVELAMHKEPANKPFSSHLGTAFDETQDHVVINGLGATPIGLDEAYPFAQSHVPRLDGLDRQHMGWVGDTKDAMLEAHDAMPGIPGPPMEGLDLDFLQVLRTADWQFGLGAGVVLTGEDPNNVRTALEAGTFNATGHAPAGLRAERSKATGKMRTVHLDGEHILSLRAEDGLFTLKEAGAKRLHAALPAPANRVVVAADSVPFNREGKSVFAQFVVACDPELRPGDECLVVDEKDALVAVGRALLNAEEMADFGHGMAVKVRQGIA